MTFDEVRAALKPLRMTVVRTGYGREVCVRRIGAAPGEGYFTDDMTDALMTGRAMAAERDSAIAAKEDAR